MFTSFTVKNFRCFRDLTIAPLGRVNLIAGKNNTGKTALLEAMYMHCWPSEAGLAISINMLQGFRKSSDQF